MPPKAESISKAAVLTGDVVRSTRNPDAGSQALQEALRNAAGAVGNGIPCAGVSGIDIFRGDSWQLLVRESAEALRAALLFRTYLCGGEARNAYSFDTRIGIGVGAVDRVDEENISQSEGSAFVASGGALDALAKSRHRMSVRLGSCCGQASAETVVVLLDALAQRWTAKQAWAVNGALQGLTQQRIGAEFVPPVAQRTVADHLEKAEWNAVQRALDWWKVCLNDVLE